MNPDNELLSMVLEMEPSAVGISHVIVALLAATDEQLSDPVTQPFVSRVHQTLLDWVAAGQFQEMRELLGRLRSELYRPPTFAELAATPTRQRLVFQLEGTGQLMAAFLRPDNLSYLLSLLAGYERRQWCDAIALIAAQGRPLAPAEFIVRGIFDDETSAIVELNDMEAEGLLERFSDGGAHSYDLTWSAIAAYRALNRANPSARAGQVTDSSSTNLSRRPEGRSIGEGELVDRCVEHLSQNFSRTAKRALTSGSAVLPGDYLLSALPQLDGVQRARIESLLNDARRIDRRVEQMSQESHDPTVFHLSWHTKLMDLSSRVLRGYAQRRGFKLNENFWRIQPHHYGFIESRIRAGKAVLPLEMIFLNRFRSPFLDVVPLTTVREMCLLCVSGKEAERALGLTEAGILDADDFFLRFRSAPTSIVPCAPFNTASHHFLWTALTEQDVERRCDTEDGPRQLTRWLMESSAHGFILCDAGIAFSVERIWKHDAMDTGPIVSTRVRYPEELPAGIAFPAGDVVWGRVLSDIVAWIRASDAPEIIRDWHATGALASCLGMSWSVPAKAA